MCSQADIEEVVAAVAEQEEFVSYNLASAPGSIKGDNYLSVINTVELVGKDKKGHEKSLHLIVKTALKSEALRENFPLGQIFHTENYFYKIIYPEFERLQKQRNVEHPYNNVPKFYYSSLENFKECIVLENLKEIGYSLWDRRVPMTKSHVELVLKTYGKYHALSFALKVQNGELSNDLGSKLIEVFKEHIEKSLEPIEKQMEKLKKLFDPVEDAQAIEKIQNYKVNLINDVKDFCSMKFEYSVFLHGDCWCNNFMFVYQDPENPKKPTDVRMIDFQVVRVATPILDIAYFFFCCSPQEIIDDYLRYLKIYHDSLSDHIRALGSDPEKLYPYETFLAQWKKYCKYGLNIACLMLKVNLSSSEEAISIEEEAEKGKSVFDAFDYNISKENEYAQRMKPIVRFFIDNDFI